MSKAERLAIPQMKHFADSNIIRQYEIQKASWIWHKDFTCTDEPHVLKFRCSFELKKKESFNFHVSADHRYELFLDGSLVSRGPDRCDVFHWSFASYSMELPAGRHSFTATAWWIAGHAPKAQVSLGRGGFIFAADGTYADMLNTGSGKWEVAEWPGWEFDKSWGIYVGSQMVMNAYELNKTLRYTKPAVVCPPVGDDFTGQIAEGRRLFPSSMPEQLFKPAAEGVVRAVTTGSSVIEEKHRQSCEIKEWQQLISSGIPVKISRGTERKVIIDLGNYFCGYPVISLGKGKGSTVKVLWAESLFEDIDNKNPGIKGNRDDIINKKFHGFGDTIVHDGSKTSEYRPLWWRSGRYIMLDISTQKEDLVINSFKIIETRYPVENESIFESSDSSLAPVTPIAVRGIQMCSHETFMDCPYYEQLMYVGDTRLEMLTTYILTGDSRLVRRGIELFDWSRYSTGFVHERYPSSLQQISLTFSMIWVLVLRDFSFWRKDPDFVRERLPGMRCMLENLIHLRNEDKLLEGLPGWSFVDWVPGWDTGMPKDARHGVSASINLFYLTTLKKAAELERHYGEPILAERYEKTAAELAERIVMVFWSDKRNLLADDLEHKSYSEHVQCLALLSDVLDARKAQLAFKQLITDSSLHRTTVYFSFYLLETFYKFGRGDLLFKKLDFWKQLHKQGFRTPVEMPEPSRSDCHAWGSHPLFHFHASIAGIRPSSSQFKTVLIRPCPGPLGFIRTKTPHPDGVIETNLVVGKDKKISGSIRLPKGITGNFVDTDGSEKALKQGENKV